MMAMFDPHAERPWSTEEDKQLRNAVLRGKPNSSVWRNVADFHYLLTLKSWVVKEKEQSRPVKWDTIAASLPRRSKKECRKRWHHTMMEAVRKCQWKPEEDERLSGAVQKSGEK